ncbi:alginate export family protein [Pseudomonas veronii]|uniref:alginate export family protein n=1 Tax=Pseudomonas veronii TaxID=76761 RepID=UPI0021BDF51B|nr:alginate export family protein [Pseudomonas veronii]MCT8965215.1 alginate export family protein [Pseudomonas veronii]
MLAALQTSLKAGAYELYSSDNAVLNADLELALGAFHSRKTYAQASGMKAGSKDWQESYAKYGLRGWTRAGDADQHLYGAVNWLSSATFGQGDAAGWTDGTERTTKYEDAYLGWKSGQAFSALGKDGLDVSFGRQNVIVGDGFLVAGDAANPGKRFGDGHFNRGGAYYLTARKAFDKTAVFRIGGAEGLRSDLMWLKSDNPIQGKAETVVGTLEHVNLLGTLGLTYLKVVDTDKEFDSIQRKGTRTASMRAQGSLGIPDLFLSGEYARQHRDLTGDESAWYTEAGWTFSDINWKPYVSYRYSRFSEGYDPLFYGNVRALGTWFQGEVASSYAGPFNNNARIQQVGLTLTPTNKLSLGVLAYRFDTISPTASTFSNLSGKEVDVYAMWQITDHISASPLVGLYRPDKDVNSGSSQLGDNHTNIYSQLTLQAKF